jgi:hypothetical protein
MEKILAVLLALSAFALICFVLFITKREIFKKTGDSFVLKDSNTIYFVTLVIIGMFFKILILDALAKEEISTQNSCSMFLSTFVPEFFIALAYTCMSLKSVFLFVTTRDTKQSYQKSNKTRRRIADIALMLYLGLLLILMFLRCCSTCQRDKVGR